MPFLVSLLHRSLNVLPLGVEPVHQLHALLVHSEDNSATHDQSCQAWQSTTPERQDAFLLEDDASAAERVAVQLACLDALHARLDGVEWLSHIDCDKTSDTAHGKGTHGAHLLSGGGVSLCQLLQRIVNGETGGAVCSLACRRGNEALEEAADATLARDHGDGVEEAAKAGIGGFAVVNSTVRANKSVLNQPVKGVGRELTVLF